MKRTLFVLILLFACVCAIPAGVSAAVSSCTVNVSVHTTTRDTSTVYDFEGMVNTSDPDTGIMWVKFTRPSANFTITNGIASGWTSSTDGSQVTFTAPAQTYFGTFTVYATSGSSDAASANWSVQMSPDGSGSSPTTCDGDLGVAISGSSSVTPTPTPTSTPVPDTTAPTISNVSVSGVSDTSVTISWQTNETANSNLNYGTSTSYTSSSGSSTQTTAHSLTLTGLSSNTTYHAQIQSTDSAGNTANSSDFTFATSRITETTTITVTTTTTTLVTPTPTPTPTPDKTPPKIILETQVANVFVKAPRIEGNVTDNVGVTKIEYTVDDGRNWGVVEDVTELGGKKVSFSFIPLVQGDDNYSVKIRASDEATNTTETTAQTMIIDRLPPAIGGALFSIGPQILDQTPQGEVVTIAGVAPKLTFSAVGGPTAVTLCINTQEFTLVQNPHTRLWSGNVDVKEPGTYTIEAESIDGAKNRTVSSLSYLTVIETGIVSDTLGPVSNAQVKVFYFDANAEEFRLWNAEQYGQKNPQRTDELGRYTLMLPPGKYYLQIEAERSRPLRTNIFELKQSTPITQHFVLTKKNTIQFGPLSIPFPDFGQNDVMMNIEGHSATETKQHPLTGKAFPDFNLDGVTQTSLSGMPTVVTVLSSWLPQSAAQLEVLDQVAEHKKVRTLVIMSQESPASTVVFAKRVGYVFPIVADPDGLLVKPLQVRTLPTHYFLNQSGVVQSVVSGVISQEQIDQQFKE